MLAINGGVKLWYIEGITNMRFGKYRLFSEVQANEAFVFYSKDYRKVKILHYDINGWVLCSKWFTDGKFLKPEFEECKTTHELSKQTLILLMSTSVQTKIKI